MKQLKNKFKMVEEVQIWTKRKILHILRILPLTHFQIALQCQHLPVESMQSVSKTMQVISGKSKKLGSTYYWVRYFILFLIML